MKHSLKKKSQELFFVVGAREKRPRNTSVSPQCRLAVGPRVTTIPRRLEEEEEEEEEEEARCLTGSASPPCPAPPPARGETAAIRSARLADFQKGFSACGFESLSLWGILSRSCVMPHLADYCFSFNVELSLEKCSWTNLKLLIFTKQKDRYYLFSEIGSLNINSGVHILTDLISTYMVDGYMVNTVVNKLGWEKVY